MNIMLKSFLWQFGSVVLAALVPVVLTAFLSMPMVLGGHPGEARTITSIPAHLS